MTMTYGDDMFARECKRNGESYRAYLARLDRIALHTGHPMGALTREAYDELEARHGYL